MHRVHVRVFQQILKVRIALFHAEGIADRLQLLRIALPDGDEFRPETEADDGNVDLFDIEDCFFAKSHLIWEG